MISGTQLENHTVGTQLENHTVEEFLTQILKNGKKGFVFSAPLGREKVTEIEINHPWPMI